MDVSRGRPGGPLHGQLAARRERRHDDRDGDQDAVRRSGVGMTKQPARRARGTPIEPFVHFPDPAIEVIDERFRSLVVGQEVVERLWTGGRWLEGPVWFGDGRLPAVLRHPQQPDALLERGHRRGDASFVSRPTTATATPATCTAGS